MAEISDGSEGSVEGRLREVDPEDPMFEDGSDGAMMWCYAGVCRDVSSKLLCIRNTTHARVSALALSNLFVEWRPIQIQSKS